MSSSSPRATPASATLRRHRRSVFSAVALFAVVTVALRLAAAEFTGPAILSTFSGLDDRRPFSPG